MWTTCAGCGAKWESDGNPAIVHKTVGSCQHCGGSIQQQITSQEQLNAKAAGLDVLMGVETEHSIEGVPVYFNSTAPKGMYAIAGKDSEHLQIHGSKEAYEKTLADPEMYEAIKTLVKRIRHRLRAKERQAQARFN